MGHEIYIPDASDFEEAREEAREKERTRVLRCFDLLARHRTDLRKIGVVAQLRAMIADDFDPLTGLEERHAAMGNEYWPEEAPPGTSFGDAVAIPEQRHER